MRFITSIVTAGTNIDAQYNILTAGNWANAGTGENPDGTKANIGVYGGLYAWGIWIKEKCALLIDNNYKYISPYGETITIATTADDKETIKEAILLNGNGLRELNNFPQSAKNLFIGAKIAVVMYEPPIKANISYNATPKFSKRLAVPTGYADLSLAFFVKKIKPNYTLSESGKVYVVVSNGGAYYGAGLNEVILDNPPPEIKYEHDNPAQEWLDWEELDKTADIQNIIDNGILIEQLEHITAEQWETIFPREREDKKIKFLYVFDIQSLSNIAKVKSLELTRESAGHYVSANLNDFTQRLYNDRLVPRGANNGSG